MGQPMQDSPGKTKQKRKLWPWLFGCGCGGCSLFLLLLIALFFGGTGLITLLYSHFEDVRQAIALAEQDSRVEEALGVPLEINWFIHRAYVLNASGDEVTLVIPVAGPKGTGRIYAQGVKVSEAKWRFDVLEVTIDASHKKILLLEDGKHTARAKLLRALTAPRPWAGCRIAWNLLGTASMDDRDGLPTPRLCVLIKRG